MTATAVSFNTAASGGNVTTYSVQTAGAYHVTAGISLFPSAAVTLPANLAFPPFVLELILTTAESTTPVEDRKSVV